MNIPGGEPNRYFVSIPGGEPNRYFVSILAESLSRYSNVESLNMEELFTTTYKSGTIE